MGEPDSNDETVDARGAASSTGPLPAAATEQGSIGPYRILERIGEGGMGVVYLAAQESPVRRRVALKVVKPGMDSDQVVARFEAERQALALMDHPNIARVLDGGSTAAGRPYFVMELVKGSPIAEYCDRRRLSTRERLEIFIPVCQAIQHAHQKGVIHRDIKPSNILVTEFDGKPLAKVIDFGVAKAMDHRLTERTMFTQLGAVMGTLEYMSPEQADLGVMDVDTRTDVYSLGVVLYELLTGSTPLERRRLKQAAYTEILRRIRDEDPPRPSTRLSGSGEALSSISARRRIDPGRLTRLIKGDLDWIVMRAIDKDRARRYDSAGGLARDIERYLAGEPVEAGPPSAGYRLGKLARKHRGVIATAGAFVGLLVVAAGVSTALAVREHRAQTRALELARAAEVERSRATAAERVALAEEAKSRAAAAEAKAVLEFFETKVLAAARPKEQEGGLGIEATIHDAVDAALPGIDQAFIDKPAVGASIRHAIGQTYWYLGKPDRALAQLEQSLAIRRKTLGPDDPATLESMVDLGMILQESGQFARAIDLIDGAYKKRQALLGDNDPATIQALESLATAVQASGKVRESIPLHEEALKRSQRVLGPDHRDALSAMGNLANALQQTARLDEAIALYEEAFRRSKIARGADHPDTLTDMNNLAWAYRDAGRFAQALPLVEESLARRKAAIGPAHPYTLFSMNDLALARKDAGRLDLAIPLFEETLKLRRAIHHDDHPYTLFTMNDLGQAYLAAGRTAKAKTLLEEAYKLSLARLGPDHPETLNCSHNLARVYLVVDPAKAEPILKQTLEARRKRSPNSWLVFDAMSLLGGSLLGQKKYTEAEPLVVGGYEGLRERSAKITAPYRDRLVEAAQRPAALYDAWGRKDQADQWRRRIAAEIPRS